MRDLCQGQVPETDPVIRRADPQGSHLRTAGFRYLGLATQRGLPTIVAWPGVNREQRRPVESGAVATGSTPDLSTPGHRGAHGPL
jgi:hypothetical protein